MKRLGMIMATLIICACQVWGISTDTLRREARRGYFRENMRFGLEYTTELQTNFVVVNWVNQLHLSYEWDLCRAVSLNAGTFSVAKTREESILDDLQGFSNIEADNMPLALSVLGLQFNWSNGNLFAGVQNVNEDYFTSPCTALFTSSSPGIFPTISEGLPIANYPFSALGIHLNQSIGNWSLKASLYNGRGYNGWRKGNHPFVINPKTDGVFALLSVDYENWESTYTLGGTVYHGVLDSVEEVLKFKNGGVFTPTTTTAMWLNVEQRLTNNLHLLLQASANFSALLHNDLEACKDYEAIGLVAHFNKADLGIIFNHATFTEAHEFTAELTTQITLTPNVSLQPTLHVIHVNAATNCVALLRLNCTFN